MSSRREQASLVFLGGAGTVTGSRFLVDLAGRRLLVDCGMFLGLKPLRLANWEPFPVDPASIDAVVLTHAHLDHSGYLPALVRDGFAGPVFATGPTAELAGTLLRDAGHIHDEDAAYANRKRFSKHDPALPLYTEADARVAERSFHDVEIGVSFEASARRARPPRSRGTHPGRGDRHARARLAPPATRAVLG